MPGKGPLPVCSGAQEMEFLWMHDEGRGTDLVVDSCYILLLKIVVQTRKWWGKREGKPVQPMRPALQTMRLKSERVLKLTTCTVHGPMVMWRRHHALSLCSSFDIMGTLSEIDWSQFIIDTSRNYSITSDCFHSWWHLKSFQYISSIRKCNKYSSVISVYAFFQLLSHGQAAEVKRIPLRSVSYGEPLKNISKKCAEPHDMGFGLTRIRLSAEGFSIKGGAEVPG